MKYKKTIIISTTVALASCASLYSFIKVSEFYDTNRVIFRAPIVFQVPITIEKRSTTIVSPLPKEKKQEHVQEAKASKLEVPKVEAHKKPEEDDKHSTLLYKGKVSYYSHAGCLGCNEKQIMGNGQPFDENKLTVAIPCEDIINKKHAYNTKVRVTNIDNNKQVQATITDCGSFSKYNRVSDLSLAVANQIGAITDKSIITIEQI